MKKFIYLFGILQFFILGSNAQTVDEFIQSSSLSKFKVLPEQQKIIENVLKNANTKSIDYVSLGSLEKVQKDLKVSLKLPKKLEKLIFKANRVEAKSVENYRWFGSLVDKVGYMSLTCEKGKIRGYITVEKDEYQILPLGEGNQYMIIELNNDHKNQGSCGTDASKIITPIKVKTPSSGRIVPCAGGNIAALIRYTPQARAYVESLGQNINQYANDYVNDYNNCIANSQITGQAMMVVVGIEEHPYFTCNASDPQGDVNTLANDNTRRDLLNADIVVLLTAAGYNVGGTIFGIAASVEPSNNQAAAIVEVTSPQTRHTFAHEVAHLFGARHDLGNNNGGDPGGAAYAHGFQSNNGLNTILQRVPNGALRIPFYSNPNISVGGSIIGIAETNDNARRIGENTPIMANFRPNGFSANIEGPDIAIYNYNLTWEAYSQCGQQPYSYEWRIACNSFNFSGVIGTGEYLTTQMCAEHNYLWLRVTSADGQVRDWWKYVRVFDNPQFRQSAEEDNPNPEKAFLNEIYPNPTQNEMSITFSLPQESEVNMVLNDGNGRIVKNVLKETISAGKHTKIINTNELQSGVYLLRFDTDNFSQVRKVVIAK
jgi:Metallo-peptidase family M12/Secretion system C-terminal sorting domain